MEAIVAVYSDWGIGDRGTQPVVLKADRAHFRELTMGAAVIVGRRTLGDFPGGRPLKGRDNIVLTRQALTIEGAQVAHSPREAAELGEGFGRCLVIGGDSVYRQMLDYVDKIHVTWIDLAPESDSFFPDLDQSPDWALTWQGPIDQEEGISYRFKTYERVTTDRG